MGVSGLNGMMAKMVIENDEELLREQRIEKEKERTRISHHLESLIAHLMDRPPHPEFLATVVNPLRLHPRYDRYRHVKKKDSVGPMSNAMMNSRHRDDNFAALHNKKHSLSLPSMEGDENVDMHLRKDIAKQFLKNISRTKQLIEERKLRDEVIKHMTEMAHAQKQTDGGQSKYTTNRSSQQIEDKSLSGGHATTSKHHTKVPKQHNYEDPRDDVLVRGRGNFTFGTGKMVFEKEATLPNQKQSPKDDEPTEPVKSTAQSRRWLRKKLKEIEQLEERVQQGEDLDQQQKEKIHRKQDFVEQLEKFKSQTTTETS
ncbi:hypothetical protein RFI_01874 [Reticulomyxa filosa]|uniref:Uncharacterized protein n=1 Tax=Reticulomyxa filosa TaxID=46433 RepID=X6P9I1_RETFI|nr:hypothetical protein RFI_01874 [Reticulomyxa filosa]|eukprot:ETO35200.1 hypothetical protein RFI_01874 [Reticulomyxa filosa]